jgi:hypothetical protein
MTSTSHRLIYEGDDMNISEPKAFVIGDRNTVRGEGSIVKGNNNAVLGAASTVIGDNNSVWADKSAVVGKSNTVLRGIAVVKGSYNHVSNHESHIIRTDTFQYCFTEADYASAAEWAKTIMEGSGILRRESRSGRVTIHVNLTREGEIEEINPVHNPPAPVVAVNTDINDIKDLACVTVTEEEDAKACIVCKAHAADVIAMPCGHKQFCAACAKQICGERRLINGRSGMAKCPSCAADVWKFGRVYS